MVTNVGISVFLGVAQEGGTQRPPNFGTFHMCAHAQYEKQPPNVAWRVRKIFTGSTTNVDARDLFEVANLN